MTATMFPQVLQYTKLMPKISSDTEFIWQ